MRLAVIRLYILREPESKLLFFFFSFESGIPGGETTLEIILENSIMRNLGFEYTHLANIFRNQPSEVSSLAGVSGSAKLELITPAPNRNTG